MFTPGLRITDVSDDLKSSLRDEAPLDTVVHVMRMAALELSANLRLRVNMMGFERQGKTSFVRALFGETLPRKCDRTVGVEIRHMSDVYRGVSSTGAKLPPCAVTLFDFGGHVEYFSLQRSFLVHDCVHVVTVNLADVASSDASVRDCALHGIGWWLEALCSRDVGGVVALLGTHLDEVRGLNPVGTRCCLAMSLTDLVLCASRSHLSRMRRPRCEKCSRRPRPCSTSCSATMCRDGSGWDCLPLSAVFRRSVGVCTGDWTLMRVPRILFPHLAWLFLA
jgi:hypothetical protein